ncbi:MAG: GvpL/GvpF family gas vesicle protein [Candidatus Desulforudis sp.]|nr:GvpL/GvpF family gas vesicle protein [Desulforudis sp.]
MFHGPQEVMGGLTIGDEACGVYLYGVIEISARVELSITGLYRVPVQVVPYRDLALVVSALPRQELKPTRELALAHERVISSVMRHYPVVPMRFGVVARQGRPITNILVDNYTLLKQKVEQIRNRVELGLKAFCLRDAFTSDIERADERIRRMKDLDATCLGQLVAEVADCKRREYVDRIYTPLSKSAVDSVLNEILTEHMVFNAAFLVSKGNVCAFEQLVHKLFIPHAGVLEYRYSGPWPPYNFCSMNLKITCQGGVCP